MTGTPFKDGLGTTWADGDGTSFFPSGGPSFGEIEDAIIATLGASVMASYCKVIDVYQPEGESVEKEIAQIAMKMPAALIVLGAGKCTQLSGCQDLELSISIMLAAASLRGKGLARRKDGGAYMMIQNCWRVLDGQDLGLTIRPLEFQGFNPEFNSSVVSIYSVDFATVVRYFI